MTAQNKSNGKGSAAAAMGMGLAAIAAAAAGAYFLYGTDAGKKKRKEVKGWMLKAKGEMLDKMETLKDVSQDTYDQVVDNVAKKYAGVKSIDPAELSALVSDVKSHWKNIKKHLEAGTKEVKKGASKVKKAASKAKKTS